MNAPIHQLIHRYLQNGLTEEERRSLEAWKNASDANRALFARLTDKHWLTEELLQLELRYDKEKGWDKIKGQMSFPEQQKRKVVQWRRWAVAAGFLLMLGIGGGLYVYVNRTSAIPAQAERFHNDVPPGKHGAILTLADGRKVSLDEAPDGQLANHANVAVSVHSGQLAYAAAERPKGLTYNTLSTPRGRTFRVQLSDGTAVWLNAASSIRYPMAFPDSAREVSITGEAYFEVARSAVPFRVKLNGMEVAVLGTHFNVAAYENDQNWKTTLAEGAVKVISSGHTLVLAPGQQAGYSRNDQQIASTKVDLEEVLSWKNDLFWFSNSDIKEVMKQLERWYDIHVTFENDVDVHFSGTIPRNVNISTILKTLELTNGVKFKVEGNKVTVLKG